MRAWAGRVTSSTWFEYTILALILGNGVLLGLETVPQFEERGEAAFSVFHWVIVGVFVGEAALKIFAVWPQPGRYFSDGWNVFDFSIVVLSVVPAAGPFATVARMARLLRALRLVSVVPEMRLIVSTLVRSLPGLGYVVALLGLIFYVYAVLGVYLFREHDPEHWRNLGIALLTLFRVVTLEDWTDVMYTAMELNSFAWIYFVSIVVLGTFVIINLFIAVVLNNLDQAKLENLEELRLPPTQEELVAELAETRDQLDRLLARLELPPATVTAAGSSSRTPSGTSSGTSSRMLPPDGVAGAGR